MVPVFFPRRGAIAGVFAALVGATVAQAEPVHGIAMYGDPALPPDFVSLPYANPYAPRGGRVVFGNSGSFDSLNPYVTKGTAPWQLRFLTHESLMARSWDEPFTLYGLLAESVETAPDRSWVEFTLRAGARFSDGSPVTVEDVIWSYETLGTKGHPRYRGLWRQIDRIEATGPRSLRLTFNTDNRELALIAGMRPILQKAQWDDKDLANAPITQVPIGSGAYVVADYEQGRHVTLRRNPAYWGADLPLRRGAMNFEELRIDYYADGTVLFEAFKAGEITAFREYNAQAWESQYTFPAARRGDVVQSTFRHGTPSGMTGFAINTRHAPLDQWQVREALILAFNYEFINDTVTGNTQPRIPSYFANSDLGLRPGPATGEVRALLSPFANTLPAGALEGYTLPQSDGTARNRKNLRRAAGLLDGAGLKVVDGQRRLADGRTLELTALLRQGDTESQKVLDIYTGALKRLGIGLRIDRVDSAQYASRVAAFDFDLTPFRRALSLSPGNEQRLYWGSEAAAQEGSRNISGIASPAVDAMIDHMLTARSREDLANAVRALDRALLAGRYAIPLWQYDVHRIAHARDLKFPAHTPLYGDFPDFVAEVWWQEAD